MNEIEFHTQSQVFKLITLLRPKIGQPLLALVFLLTTCQAAFCVTRFFEGGDWHSASNWTNNLIPGPDDDIIMQGDGVISQSTEVNNINVGDNHLFINNPATTLTARYIFVLINGKLVNQGQLNLSKDVGNLDIRGEFTNLGTMSFIENCTISGIGTNNGTITGIFESNINVAFAGVFNNHGQINGHIDLINLSNTSIFNNDGVIELDLTLEGRIRLINNAHFYNTRVLNANAIITIEDDALFENRKQVDMIHTAPNQFVRLQDSGHLLNYGNMKLNQQNGSSTGITHLDNAQFDNSGLFILENAKFSITPDTSVLAYFRNRQNGRLYISNTANEGIRFGASVAKQFQNSGLLSLCQTNQTSGTCPITSTSNTVFQNLASGHFFTGADIFTSDCNSTVQNSIVNAGEIFPACASEIDFSCPLTYTGVNTITDTIIGPQVFEAHFDIESSDAFINADTVTFDSGTSITLKENFQVSLNTVFKAFIDGCGGM